MNTGVLSVFFTFLGVSLSAKPPKIWKENWFEHNQLLTLQYHDNDVAVYFDPDVDRSASTWINPFLHDVWVYVKKVYGKYGDDPILYGIFHAGKYNGCRPSTYFDSLRLYRNVIDCGRLNNNNVWSQGTDIEYDLILRTISFIIHGAAHGVNHKAPLSISGWSFDLIIAYDVYLGINRTEHAQRWREIFIIDHENVMGKEVYWFRDWFLPIYEKYGGAKVLNHFLELKSQYFPKSNTASFQRPEYTRDMTHGELFHFWSAATGRNLKQMATKVFGWKDKYENEFQNAMEEFPQLVSYYNFPETYWQENWQHHGELLTRQFSDDHVAIYFDQNVDKSITWVNKLLHDVWVHTKKNYGHFGPDPVLYGIFHGKHSSAGIFTYYDSQKLYKNVVDFGSFGGNWRIEAPQNVFFIIKMISKIVQSAAHGVANNPSFNLWGHTWDDIFVLDVLFGINRTDEAYRLYDERLGSYRKSPKPRTYWFRDWFLPIYEQYGGSGVLNRYFELLAKYFPKVRNGNTLVYSRNLNFGELVHFWSGAAQTSLRGLASEAFDWNLYYEKQYQNARKEFPDVKYNSIIIL